MDDRINLLRKQIFSNLQGNWTVEKMAQVICLSTSQLRNIFKAEAELQPCAFLRKIRLEKARELLEISLKSVKEIGREVGMPDQSHFVRYFKAEYGRTPSDHRKENWRIGEIANE